MASKSIFVRLWLAVSLSAWVVPRATPSPMQLSLTIAHPSGKNETMPFDIEEEQLITYDLTGKDLENTLIFADEQGMVSAKQGY